MLSTSFSLKAALKKIMRIMIKKGNKERVREVKDLKEELLVVQLENVITRECINYNYYNYCWS